MTHEEARSHARRWADDWNAGDLDAVLGHFDVDVVFSSPKAMDAVGVPTVRGRQALRAYWEAALKPVSSLRFTVDRIIWDAETSELSIIYDRDINGQRDRASEILRFGPSGLVVSGEVHYGVIPGAL